MATSCALPTPKAEVEELFALNAEVEAPFAAGNVLLPFVLHADIPTVKSK